MPCFSPEESPDDRRRLGLKEHEVDKVTRFLCAIFDYFVQYKVMLPDFDEKCSYASEIIEWVKKHKEFDFNREEIEKEEQK